MSLQTRKELLIQIQGRYQKATWKKKRKIIDEFIAITAYQRKYAIYLLNQPIADSDQKKEKRLNKRKYDEAVRQALLSLWYSANQICSKRLAPFIPELLASLEKFGHLSLPVGVRHRLLNISPATIDRLLVTVRQEAPKSISTTRPGSLIKRQIKIRTFSDWNDVVPGFMESDLVAHCGDSVDGSFLNTLVMTDIASTWTEFFPLLHKSEAGVISALKVAQQILPFKLLGIDTDNGSEFINYGLLDFCKENEITFTRSRAYKKNDQAHVEERNGSIVRRLIGYDRYEGLEAYNALSKLYAVLRVYVNFFQPSLKLISKKREGAKVTKKYDKAKTPYQRLIVSNYISEQEKNNLKELYNKLDPVQLLKDLEKLQDNFWQFAWKGTTKYLSAMPKQNSALLHNNASSPEITINNKVIIAEENINLVSQIRANDQAESFSVEATKTAKAISSTPALSRRYRRTDKPSKQVGPRTWRTRKDPFEKVWNELLLQLTLQPEYTAKNLLDNLIKRDANQFSIKLLRTLQRRIADWRAQQIKVHQEQLYESVSTVENPVTTYASLVAHAVVQR